nr:PlyM18 [uncultured phage]
MLTVQQIIRQGGKRLISHPSDYQVAFLMEIFMAYELRDNRRSTYLAKGRANTAIDVIVIHHWGVDGQNWENLTTYTANNRNMSTHYVAMAGKVERQVDEEDTAYHGGNPPINQRSIGIECRPEATDGDYDTVAELVADIWNRHGKLPLVGHKQVPSVRPGQQYVATSCPGRYDVERIRKEAEGWYTKKYAKKDSDARPKTHTVVSGESYWSIAAKYLGDGMRYTEILDLNKVKDPSALLVGQVLELPEKYAKH